jgi:hypothetical protein
LCGRLIYPVPSPCSFNETGIGDEGAVAIAEMLTYNKTLTVLE